MRVRHWGHACLQVEAGAANVLIDPGTFSDGFEDVTGLSAVLITHVHADHLDVSRFAALIEQNPDAAVYCDKDSAVTIREEFGGTIAAQEVSAGDVMDVGTRIEVVGGDHAIIHADLPRAVNVGYVIWEEGEVEESVAAHAPGRGTPSTRLLHPGDSFVRADDIDLLAVPVSGPWMALKEAIDFVREVRPGIVIPIHEALHSDIGMGIARRMISNLIPEGTQWVEPTNGEWFEIPA